MWPRAQARPETACPMNQTRTFLLIAWLMVAFLLWQEWGKEKVAAAQPAPAIPAAVQGEVPAAAATPVAAPAAGAVAQASAVAAAPTPAPAQRRAGAGTERPRRDPRGTAPLSADPRRRQPAGACCSIPTRRSSSPREACLARRRRRRGAGAAAAGRGARDRAGRRCRGRAGAASSPPPPTACSIRRTYTLARGSYAVRVRDEVVNAGNAAWHGYVYRQLERVPPAVKTGFTNPEVLQLQRRGLVQPGRQVREAQVPELRRGRPAQPAGHRRLDRAVCSIISSPPGCRRRTRRRCTRWPRRATLLQHRRARPAASPWHRASGPDARPRLWVGPKLVEQDRGQHVPGLDSRGRLQQLHRAVQAAGRSGC